MLMVTTSRPSCGMGDAHAFDSLADAFGHDARAFAIGLREQQREFFSAVARGKVARPGRMALDHGRDLLQAMIPGLVSVGVVEGLEVIGIDQQHRQGLSRPASEAEFALRAVVEASPVGKPGQAVECREARQMTLELLVLRDVAGHGYHAVDGRFRGRA